MADAVSGTAVNGAAVVSGPVPSACGNQQDLSSLTLNASLRVLGSRAHSRSSLYGTPAGSVDLFGSVQSTVDLLGPGGQLGPEAWVVLYIVFSFDDCHQHMLAGYPVRTLAALHLPIPVCMYW